MTEASSDARFTDRIFVLLQLCLPTRWLSMLVFKLTQIRHVGFKNRLIRLFLSGYTIDLQEAECERIEDYNSFNHFFTRALKPGARVAPDDPRAFVSPVDGTLSQFGRITEDRLIQAKGHSYSLYDLLPEDAQAGDFLGGEFCTIYLAPYNYHRIHMPIDGRLAHWTYVPGRLFSVNAATARALPNLFTRNERLNARFDTPAGAFALSMVGALFVGSLETVWSGRVSPPHLRRPGGGQYTPMSPVVLARSAEMGRFNMGSTVILLTQPGAVSWSDALQAGQALRLGESLGHWNPKQS
ncbi:archaetidylserine decarboxylase [Solimonas terrae]|uniref:Phosphatidylserine decarboxylase proenzyme n=1 Tax=Solimonas terrae TaxID=1396819 RepID=A0A6M2BUM7_9GAMM|nr:archaetidylserine decarboxylase [Solimonas terrae]NGY06198.1 phosphatidylserine decarboxylase [Solimonas terrae]